MVDSFFYLWRRMDCLACLSCFFPLTCFSIAFHEIGLKEPRQNSAPDRISSTMEHCFHSRTFLLPFHSWTPPHFFGELENSLEPYRRWRNTSVLIRDEKLARGPFWLLGAESRIQNQSNSRMVNKPKCNVCTFNQFCYTATSHS